MLTNMNKFKGLVFSQGVMLKLTQKGVKREDGKKDSSIITEKRG